MIQVQHYELLGQHPAIEGFDVERGIEEYREAAKSGQHGLQFALATKLTFAAAHFFGLSSQDFESVEGLVTAMEAMNTELAVH